MKKKYSDPMMFSSILLGDIVVSGSDDTVIGDDDEITINGSRSGALGINADPAAGLSDSVTISNPVEDAAGSEEVITDGASAEAAVSSPLEAGTVMDMLAPAEDIAHTEAGE